MREGYVAPKQSGETSPEMRITACIGAKADFDPYTRADIHDLDAIPVDYYGNTKKWNRFNQLNGGEGTYVISAIDASNKESKDYLDCTGLAAVGTDKRSGETVSLLTHQDPKQIVQEHRDRYIVDMTSRLMELHDNCSPHSIDVMLFGGAARNSEDMKGYRESIMLLRKLCEKTLGIDPHVVVGPNNPDFNQWDWEVGAVLDTKHRRLYITRAPQDTVRDAETSFGFKASELENVERRWRNPSNGKT
ncbi:MAG: hypothetical protein WDN10_02650 [bacterium]